MCLFGARGKWACVRACGGDVSFRMYQGRMGISWPPMCLCIYCCIAGFDFVLLHIKGRLGFVVAALQSSSCAMMHAPSLHRLPVLLEMAARYHVRVCVQVLALLSARLSCLTCALSACQRMVVGRVTCHIAACSALMFDCMLRMQARFLVVHAA